MKVFKFPGSNMLQQDNINTAKCHKYERDYLNRSPKQSQMKKSGSLDLSYYYLNKNKQLRKVYRAYSLQKKIRAKSTNSSKSTHQQKLSGKPSNIKIQNPKRQLFHPEKKIFLKTQKKAKYFFNQLKSNLLILNQKIQKCLQTKSQKLFLQQYTQALKIFEYSQNKQNDCEILPDLLSNLGKCQSRKIHRQLNTLNDKIALLQKQKSYLTVEVKKVKLKQQVLSQEIKKLTDRNLQLSRQIKKYKEKLVTHQSAQTSQPFEFQYNQNIASQMQKQFPKLIQQLRQLKQKQIRMNILIVQLQRDGVNLQKVYSRALKYNQKMIKKQRQKQKQQNSEYSSQQQQQSQNMGYLKEDKKNIKKNKSPKKKQEVYKNQTSCDADQSIIEQIDALSFDFKDKQNQPEVYTPRHIYICQKPLDENLKKQLQLNFDCLYQQQDQNGDQSKTFPTI